MLLLVYFFFFFFSYTIGRHNYHNGTNPLAFYMGAFLYRAGESRAYGPLVGAAHTPTRTPSHPWLFRQAAFEPFTSPLTLKPIDLPYGHLPFAAN